MKSFMQISVVCIVLSMPALSQAQMWSFTMLDSLSNPVAGTLEIILNPVTQGAIPILSPIDINGLVTNSADNAPGDDLTLSGYSVSSAQLQGSVDGQPYFTWDGETTPDTPSIPSWLGDVISPGFNETVPLGSFDPSAFLATLPADGQIHAASLDFEISAEDASGADFNPQQPSIIPGPPSLIVKGQVNPSGGPIVPEPSTLAFLLSAGAGALGFVFRRR
jgi:hypothetical protein